MNFEDYQKRALTTGRAANAKDEVYHRVLGLVGEAGEIAEKFKKLIRDHNGDLQELDIDDIKKELGDVLWYVATLADYLHISLDDVAATNLVKLHDRKRRDVIKGSGDNR